jgi:hypothetical protein
MNQAYRWDVTGALNIVKFRSGFASNKGQRQTTSTTLRVNAPVPSAALQSESGATTTGNWLEKNLIHNELWLSQKREALE